MNAKSRRGFTLIELMTVIVILGILATVLIVKIPGIIDSARVKATKTEMLGVATGAKAFYNDFKFYPYSWECYVMTPEATDEAFNSSNTAVAFSDSSIGLDSDDLEDRYKGTPYIEGELAEIQKDAWDEAYEVKYLSKDDVESGKQFGLAIISNHIKNDPDNDFDGIVFIRVDGTKR